MGQADIAPQNQQQALIRQQLQQLQMQQLQLHQLQMQQQQQQLQAAEFMRQAISKQQVQNQGGNSSNMMNSSKPPISKMSTLRPRPKSHRARGAL